MCYWSGYLTDLVHTTHVFLKLMEHMAKNKHLLISKKVSLFLVHRIIRMFGCYSYPAFLNIRYPAVKKTGYPAIYTMYLQWANKV